MRDPETNILGGDRNYTKNEKGYLIVGIGQVFSERTQDEWMPPYTCQLWFYGTEIYFQENIGYFEENTVYQEPGLHNLYYLIIPPNTLPFPTGDYEFIWGISFYSGGE